MRSEITVNIPPPEPPVLLDVNDTKFLNAQYTPEDFKAIASKMDINGFIGFLSVIINDCLSRQRSAAIVPKLLDTLKDALIEKARMEQTQLSEEQFNKQLMDLIQK